MIKYRISFLSLLLLISFWVQAQTSTLSGVITDSNSKELMIGVSVINQDNIGIVSDINGKYSLKLPSGTHTISYSSIGYATQVIDITLKPNEEKKLNVLMEAVVNVFDDVVITGSKFEQKESEITMSVAVIKPAIIENKATTSVDDILQNASGVSIVDGEPQIRGGSGFNFGAGSRVTIMVDDMNMLSGDAGRPTWGFLPVENIEQIEIIKGASSVLYGSSALSGVINIRTGFAKAKPKTKATVFHGFYDNPRTAGGKYWDNTPMQTGINLFHSRKIKDLSIVMGISLLGDDGYLGPIIDEVSGDTASSKYSPFKANRYGSDYRYRGNINLNYRPKSFNRLSFGLNTNWLKGESLATLLWDNEVEGLYKPLSGAATRTKRIVGNVDPSITYLSRKETKHILRGRWQHLDNDNDNDQGNTSDVYFGEYQVQQNFDSLGIKDFIVTAGLTASHTNSESDLFKGRDSTGSNTFDNRSVYLQIDKKFFNKLNFSAGFRYERFSINGTTEAKPVFRSGLNYQLFEATFIRASIGQGYRFPSIAEKYITTSVGLLNILPNENLRSETSLSKEVGIRQGFAFGKFSGMIDVAVFQQEFEDFIEFTFGQYETPDGLNNLFGLGFKSVNTGDAKVTGIEANIGGAYKSKNLEITASFGYTYTKPVSLSPDYVYANYEGEPNPGIIDRFASISYQNTSSDPTDNILKYRIQDMQRAELSVTYKKAYSIGFSYRRNSQMQNVDQIYYELDDPGVPHIPFGINNWTENHKSADIIMDGRISYNVKDKHKFSFIVNNMFNEEYTLRPLKIESPRTFVVQYVFNL